MIDRAEAKELALRELTRLHGERGWPEPVKVMWGCTTWTVLVPGNRKSGYWWVVVRKSDGAILKVAVNAK
jgi:hypothetical protein